MPDTTEIQNKLQKVILIGIPALYITLTTTAQRFRDMGKTGGFALLMLVPYLGFLVQAYAMAAPGEKKPNKHGAPTT